jgi:hypothetical protein
MMKVTVGNKVFETEFFPFFRTERNEDFEVWGLRLPSGKIEDVLIFDVVNPMKGLIEYAEYLIREYVLEEDIALTDKAIEFKTDLKELFHEV